MTTFTLTDIEWETDGKKVKLPKQAVVECYDEDEIANALSDEFDWLVNDFKIVAIDGVKVDREV